MYAIHDCNQIANGIKKGKEMKELLCRYLWELVWH